MSTRLTLDINSYGLGSITLTLVKASSGTTWTVTGISGTTNDTDPAQNLVLLDPGTYNNNNAPWNQSVTPPSTNNNTLDSNASASSDYLGDSNLVAFSSADGTHQYGLGFSPEFFVNDFGMSYADGKYTYISTNFNGWSSIGASATVSSGVFCFLTGTRITTPSGEVAIESLSIGDEVVTGHGEIRKIFWVGKKTRSSIFTAEKNLPIEISAGGLGGGLPKRDLRVLPAHAFLIDDVLVVAGQLVNGTTIRKLTPEELGEQFTYYAIETEDHTLILAEGQAAETKGPIKGNPGAFDNWDEYVSLYGEQGREYPQMSYPRIRMVDILPQEIWERVHGKGSRREVA